ncbi:flap endonuclease GEN homolog 1 isoform X1 [Mirounga leonina]|uniref:flap endonuclease GEN homolog 1 isoform X1 n=2 Tax=Mirounga leonina TaxID=9715 RepID=UPI00156C4C4A|nr:flap endonuclease GEN homolog 1 isoform X1 [Mirounga leonina]XP_034856525.1 flap endonuclease GEN homolog 1 isoform X1 [Mirounga leonina]XP_034856526.1 flap endonuclease GEN homolog 1 isoform X1 [Mirounga leonina]
MTEGRLPKPRRNGCLAQQVITRMGVNDLWQILEPVKQPLHLHNLRGKTIAVDLSLWVCEAQTVKKMIGTVMKPHLRNLFFRISYLTLMDVKLVFVMEGEPPKLKADVISRRNQIRYGPSGKTWSQKTGRSHFKSVLKECLDMLECLGIPWVQAAGEAEAMCAYLNTSGYVDGCLTNDGDVFLYGAQTVYRNFTMNTKDPHVDCYTMSSIKSKLGLDRDALVGLAVLLGCDYLPKGVPGVGKEQALKLIRTLKGQSLLQRFTQWNEESCSDPQPLAIKKLAHCSVCSHPGSPKDHVRNGCKFCKTNQYCEPHDYEYCCPCEWHRTEHDRQLSAVENSIKKKACSCEGFPFHKVIQEFLSNKDKLVKVIRYQRPDLLLFQRFTLEKMEWPNHYACEKLLVLLTHYDMIERKLGRRNSNQLQPIRILKTRIRNGIHCFEIEWEKPEHYALEDKHGELVLQTIEEESLFEAAYPEIVAVYQKQNLELKGKKQKSMKIKSKESNWLESDNTKSFQSQMTLNPTCEVFSKQNSKLHLEITPDRALPQKSISASLNSLILPEDTLFLNTQEHLVSSPRPLAMQQVTAVSKSLIPESSQPSTSSHNISAIADLQLSTIDWEDTSFSNSPAIPRNTSSHGLKSELETAIPENFKHFPEELSCESEWCTTNINKVLDQDLQKTNPEEHLLSGITHLHLQDLPLKERIHIKSSYPQDNAQPNVDLKTLSLLTIKESCITNSGSDCPSHLSNDLLGIHLQNESRKSKVLKGDQLFGENYKMNTSKSYSVNNPIVKTSSVRAGPPNTALDHSRKVDVQTTQRSVMKKSVCLDRHSSDEESVPVFEKAKNTTQKMKHSSQKCNPAQFEKDDANKLNNPKIYMKETEQCVQAYKTAGNEEYCFPDAAKGSLSFLQRHKYKGDSGTSLDSPLPLCQRLKLRFQNS